MTTRKPHLDDGGYRLRASRRLWVSDLYVNIGCLVLLEVAIRVSGIVAGDTMPSPLGFQSLPGQMWAEGSSDDSVVYLGGRTREVQTQPVGLRVLVVGGSAVHGERYSPFTAFPGQLERHLNSAIDTPVEVINLAMTGIGVRHVRHIVEMALEMERPDLVIVYSGNNEFHEMRVLKTVDTEFDSRVWLLRRAFFRLHVYRLLRRVAVLILDLDQREQREQRVQPLRNHDIAKLETTVDDGDRTLVESLYRQELEGLIHSVQSAGVPLLLSTVADNLRWPRSPSECPLDSGNGVTQEAHRQMFDEIDLLSPQQRLAQAEALLQDREALYSSPRAMCIAGNILADADRFSEARPLLEKSEYHAPRPFRSNGVQREIVRSLATATDVELCDIDVGLRKWSPGGIPGWDVFDDTSHPNALGHYRIGGLLAQCVLEQGMLHTQGDPVVRASLEQIGEGGPESDRYPVHPEASVRMELDEMVEAGPVGNVFRLDLWGGSCTRSVTVGGEVLQPTNDSSAAAAAAGHRAFIAGHYVEAVAFYQLAMERGGPQPDLRASEGLARLFMADIAGARAALDEALLGLDSETYLVDLRATLGS